MKTRQGQNRFWRGSNSRPSACKADVITTTPQNQTLQLDVSLLMRWIPLNFVSSLWQTQPTREGLRGATVARLTPDQKVACSNHVGVKHFFIWASYEKNLSMFLYSHCINRQCIPAIPLKLVLSLEVSCTAMCSTVPIGCCEYELQNYIQVPPRFELGSQDSESWVLTITPRGQLSMNTTSTWIGAIPLNNLNFTIPGHKQKQLKLL